MPKLKEILCDCCFKPFLVSPQKAKDVKYKRSIGKKRFCSEECRNQNLNKEKPLLVSCLNCGKEFFKDVPRIKKYPNHFCSSSCAASFNNKNKSFGIRRSKLEVWLEAQLTNLYSTLEIHFNRKDTINSELDIHIPSLKLAFELNGIFHYEPIYESEKLSQIQNNDHRKFAACAEKGISLCIIDSSKFSYFKEDRAKPFLDIITKLVNEKLSKADRVEVL